MRNKKLCRLCGANTNEIINLGTSPVANNFIKNRNENFNEYNLIISYCLKCHNIQLNDILSPNKLYLNYTYLTPDVNLLSKHYDRVTNFLLKNKYIDSSTKVLEVGSNTGFFLKNINAYVKHILGIDPAKNIAKLANKNNIPTIADFFNLNTAKKIKDKYGNKNFIIARHMFAHNPFPQDLIKGFDYLLNKKGLIFIENAYVIPTLKNGEFDQIYHEHMFYYSISSIDNLFNKFSFEIINIKKSLVHGGTMCFIIARKGQFFKHKIVSEYKKTEIRHFNDFNIFKKFRKNTINLKENILKIINLEKKKKRKIAAYGASAKAFTMFAFLELDEKTIKYCIDTTSTKIGKLFPKFNIKVISETQHLSNPADTFLITSWNYKKHIIAKKDKLFKKGNTLIFPLPNFEIIHV